MKRSQQARVEIEKVSLAYGATRVLHELSLTIEPGEFFALVGPSGSGKSTLLRLLAGFLQPQSGTIRVGGEDVTRVPPWRRDIGMVFQNYALWPHLTVAQNVAFGLEERRLPREVVRKKVAEALELVGLADLGARRPGELSGGQQQRVALARTLAVEPKVLLLDEPLSNLDAKLRVHMRGELVALQRSLGITTIFVTHDQEEALSIADRVAVLDQGVIRQVGTPMELYDRPANRFVASFVGTINLLAGTIEIADGAAVLRAPGADPIPLPGPHAPGAVEIAFRPHALELRAAAAPRDPGRVWLEGRVSAREFLGEFVRYQIAWRDARLIADQPHLGGEPGFAPGEAVQLGIDPAQLKLLPR